MSELAQYLKNLQERTFRLYGTPPRTNLDRPSRVLAMSQALMLNGIPAVDPLFKELLAAQIRQLDEAEQLLPTPYEDANWYGVLMRA
ncbi:MAG TPA: hypothetical protein VFQ43_08025, partial [Nitrososphaera sp.]|nr:hypothetical protein [Nitrososphaera sp.]